MRKCHNKFINTGLSIPAVRMHGVHVDRVQFPAARKNANRKVKIMPIFNDLNLDNWKDSEIFD